MFQTLCSGQNRKSSANDVARTMSTNVEVRRHHPAANTATTTRNHIHGGRGISGWFWSARKPNRWIANVVTFSYRMLCV